MERLRETWAEVDLDAILHNLREAKKLLKPGTKLAAVLKADAYGHGAVKIAELLANGNVSAAANGNVNAAANGDEEHVDMLAVACLSEALEIRKKLPCFPILIMGYTFDNHLKIAVENDITLTVFSPDQAKIISEAASGLCKTAKIHIKIDTGFNRLGMKPGADAEEDIVQISQLKNIQIEGIFTHLALTDRESDEKQFNIFMQLNHSLENRGLNIPVKHICDSIGMVRYPQYQLDMVRAGAFIYGAGPKNSTDIAMKLKTAICLKARIAHIKEIKPGEGISYDYTFKADRPTRVGTLPIGYADGYMRCLSNKGFARVRGKKARVIGLICMDQCMIDLTEIPEAAPGDEAVLLGGQGDNAVPLLEASELAGTNRNELLSGISRRVPRVYIKNDRIVDMVDYLA